MKKHSVVIVDDHLLFAQSLLGLVNTFEEFEVLYHVKNGSELIKKLLESENVPDIILLDINMPVMNGFETMEWIKENRPSIQVLALSMDDHEETIIKMLRLGAKGYLLKDIHPEIFNKALHEVVSNGIYYSERVATTLLNSLHGGNDKDVKNGKPLKDTELMFLKLACTEMTYKEIAQEMCLSPKTIDGYRESLFKHFKVKSRIGLVLYAIRNNLVNSNK
ncbi:response regulator [Kordia sp.]|uniref:response regulator n=1 Tax=Kordia sp. TaxID=1965332 RepID=UPI003D2A6D7C